MFKKFFTVALAAVLGFVANANAALTAAQVDMTSAQADITTVFLAIIGVLVLIFGYRKIMGMIR